MTSREPTFVAKGTTKRGPAVELVTALRYKLRMFGVPVDGPTNMFCDNKAV